MTTKNEGEGPLQVLKRGWTQDQAIAYETARECINDLIGIYTDLVESERTSDKPDDAKVAAYNAMRITLAAERQDLRLHDAVAVERINRVYGARIRSLRAGTELLI